MDDVISPPFSFPGPLFLLFMSGCLPRGIENVVSLRRKIQKLLWMWKTGDVSERRSGGRSRVILIGNMYE